MRLLPTSKPHCYGRYRLQTRWRVGGARVMRWRRRVSKKLGVQETGEFGRVEPGRGGGRNIDNVVPGTRESWHDNPEVRVESEPQWSVIRHQSTDTATRTHARSGLEKQKCRNTAHWQMAGKKRADILEGRGKSWAACTAFHVGRFSDRYNCSNAITTARRHRDGWCCCVPQQ